MIKFREDWTYYCTKNIKDRVQLYAVPAGVHFHKPQLTGSGNWSGRMSRLDKPTMNIFDMSFLNDIAYEDSLHKWSHEKQAWVIVLDKFKIDPATCLIADGAYVAINKNGEINIDRSKFETSGDNVHWHRSFDSLILAKQYTLYLGEDYAITRLQSLPWRESQYQRQGNDLVKVQVCPTYNETTCVECKHLNIPSAYHYRCNINPYIISLSSPVCNDFKSKYQGHASGK